MVLGMLEISDDNFYQIGGKAQNLHFLSANGFIVPPWVVIPCNSIENNDYSVEDVIAKLPNSKFYAVRSSAIGEDSDEHSWAGLFESYLFVKREGLSEKIKAVVHSANSDRVKSYSKENGTIKIAVIVQVMIHADVAGVAFSINPVSGNRKQKVVEAVYGVGEGLVSGSLQSDNYIIENENIQQNIVVKTCKADLHPDGGVFYTAVDASLQMLPTLNNMQLLHIDNQLGKLYSLSGKYQDIEFAIKNGACYFLQTRPITTHVSSPDTSSNYSVWDNSNIIESYPGVTAPLTFSFIVTMYERVYIQMMELFGITQKQIEKNKYVFKNMLGLMYGRVYYNLYSWYKVLSMLPGYSLNAQFMEKMMGVKETFELKDFQPKSKRKDFASVLKMAYGLYRNIRRLPRNTEKFEKHFECVMTRFWKYNLNELNPHELLMLYRELEDDLLSKWKPPLVNDFFAMIYYGILPKLIEKYAGKEYLHLQNGLLSGANDIVSAKPAKLIQQIVEQIHKDDNMHALFTNNSAEYIWNYVQTHNKATSKLIKKYIAQFGDRCVGELKLETKTYKQQPEKFIAIVKSQIDNNTVETRNTSLREDAEALLKIAFRGKPIKKVIVRHVLKKARTLVSNRENLRFRRTQAYGLVREIFIALGKKFYAENILSHSDDIFYLSIDEVFNYIEGKSLNVDLHGIAEIRKEEYKKFEEKAGIDERFKTYGIPYVGNNLKNDKPISESENSLYGIGCCAGKIKKTIRIVTDPSQAGVLNGEILVTSSTDPGWVTLFSSISGIIVERGSLLSHSAIVSREMGIPCIVGVTNAMKKLKNGDIVEMDGATGSINIIKK